MAKDRRGFTLIELLTVIAIIALLAAILFPVFQRVNENRRFATCMSNLQSIHVAVGLYRDDNGGEYPPVLFGPAERPDKLPWLQGDTVVPMGQAQSAFLYPTYIKDIEKFHCPNDPVRDRTVVVQAAYPQNSPWSAVLPAGQPTFNNGGMAMPWLPPSYNDQPMSFYAYDSYDISASLDVTGKRLAGAGSNPGYFVVYSKDWTAVRARGIDPKKDAPNQLEYQKSMPTDKTILASCNYHVVTSGGNKCPVMFASGTAKPLDFKQMVTDGWNIANK